MIRSQVRQGDPEVTMIKAIRIHEFGGPEVMALEDVDVGPPGPNQVRIAHRAIGLNMVDTYYRSGLYPVALPTGLGGEAAAVVVSLGDGVRDLSPGDRVVYAAPVPLDAYSQERVLDARWLVPLPRELEDETAAAMMLKGLTTWYLFERSYKVRPGDWILLYAAAGGVGLIASQWAKAVGARTIGIVSTQAKRELALAHGCEHVLLSSDDIVARVRELTDGAGVAAVYDSVGRDTFYQSLDCLRPHGTMVSFGNASGAVEPFAPIELTKRGSLFVTRPTLYDFIGSRAELEAGARALFGHVLSGQVRIHVNQRFSLADAAEAHRALEARRTTGSSVLLPDA
jgi:NADPH2:quinone reductase